MAGLVSKHHFIITMGSFEFLKNGSTHDKKMCLHDVQRTLPAWRDVPPAMLSAGEVQHASTPVLA